MKGVSREHDGVSVSGRETAQLRLDLIRADQGSVEDALVLGELGDRRSCSRAGRAALPIERYPLNPAAGDQQREPDEVAAGGATGGAGEGTVGLRPAARAVAQVLLEEIAVHAWKLSGSNLPSAAPAW